MVLVLPMGLAMVLVQATVLVQAMVLVLAIILIQDPQLAKLRFYYMYSCCQFQAHNYLVPLPLTIQHIHHRNLAQVVFISSPRLIYLTHQSRILEIHHHLLLHFFFIFQASIVSILVCSLTTQVPEVGYFGHQVYLDLLQCRAPLLILHWLVIKPYHQIQLILVCQQQITLLVLLHHPSQGS